MLGVPELACEEDFGARNTAPPNAITYLGFVAVDGGAIDVTIACFECCLDGALNFSRFRLPCAEAYGRYLRACIKGEVSGKGHVYGSVTGGGLRIMQYNAEVMCDISTERTAICMIYTSILYFS